ncbi:MAG: recombination regulator RecX [Gammaproteobacteria bacterium]|nr:recombination regulator RecX [Gammaproteobacteria bacterium]
MSLPDSLRDDPFSPQRMRAKAMDYLARREHGAAELVAKLIAKDCPAPVAESVVSRLVEENLVSDERYVEALVNSRRNRGQGPRRIQQELRDKGITDELIGAYLDHRDPVWLDSLRQVRIKKFGSKPAIGYKERAKQARFLQYRGFSPDQIFQVLGGDED